MSICKSFCCSTSLAFDEDQNRREKLNFKCLYICTKDKYDSDDYFYILMRWEQQGQELPTTSKASALQLRPKTNQVFHLGVPSSDQVSLIFVFVMFEKNRKHVDIYIRKGEGDSLWESP